MSWTKMIRSAASAVALALAVAICSAQDDDDQTRESSGSWALGLAGQIDEESNDSVFATFNWGVAPSTWLSFAAGRSSSPADRAAVDVDTVAVAVDHRFDTIGFTVEIERWGDSAALEVAELRGSVYFARERFRVGVTRETRDIDIPFTLTGPFGGTLRRTAALSSDGTGLNVRVAPAQRWWVYFGATDYDYDRNLTLLPRIERINLLSTSTLTLANSFIDDERSIGVERELGRSLLNVGITRDRSAIDGSKFETLDVAVLFPIGARMDLEVNLGRGRSDFSTAGLHGGVLLLIYGR